MSEPVEATPARRPQITEFLIHVEALRRAGTRFTVLNLFPDLRGRLCAELAETSIGELVAFDLLSKAPTTWLRAPPTRVFELEGGELVAERICELLDGLRDFNRVRMMMNPGAAGVLGAAVAASSGDSAIEARRRIRDFLSLEPERILPAGSISQAMFQDGGLFEEQVHAWTTSIHAIAEGWYLPMLQTAVDLTVLARGRFPRWKEPVMLGAAMAAGRREWRDPGMRDALLRNEVKIIRNSRAHYSHKLNFEAETVGFETVVEGRKRTFGPVSKVELRNIGARLIESCSVVRAALEFVDDDDLLATCREHGLFTGIMRHLVNPLARKAGTPTGPEFLIAKKST